MPSPVVSLADLDPGSTYSYADYLSWQFEGWEEILRGKLMTPPTYNDAHQRVCGCLQSHLLPVAKTCGLSSHYRTSVAFLSQAGAAESVVVPDFFVLRDRGQLDGQGCLGAPNLIIEVTALGTAARDWREKFDLYEGAGVGEYWIVDPMGQAISVFVRDAISGRFLLAGEYSEPGPIPCATLPELGLEWADVFPPAGV